MSDYDDIENNPDTMFLSIAEMHFCLQMRIKNNKMDESNPILQKTMHYLKKFNNCNDENTNTIRTILTREEIREPEATQLWNLSPGSVEEAQSLVPSLKNYPDEVIEKVIKEISELS